MKRRLLIVAVFLLAGAVVNVAVAWGCAAWIPLGKPNRHTVLEDGAWWVVTQFEALGSTRIVSVKGIFELSVAAVVTDAEEMLPYWASPLAQSRTAIRDARGFPARSLHCTTALVDGTLTTDLRYGGLTLRPWQPMDMHRSWRALPLRPIWPGFAVNTALYAAVLWLLIPGPFALRRFIRVRRGLCHACAYPRGESDVCSECGKALPRRARATT